MFGIEVFGGRFIGMIQDRAEASDSMVVDRAKRAPSTVRVVARPGNILLTCRGSSRQVYRMKRGGGETQLWL